MAEEKKYPPKPVRIYPNGFKTPGDKKPDFQVYLEFPEGLAPGKYKAGVWKNEYQGKVSYDGGKIEPHVPKEQGAGGYKPTRQSDQQYNTPEVPNDLPF